MDHTLIHIDSTTLHQQILQRCWICNNRFYNTDPGRGPAAKLGPVTPSVVASGPLLIQSPRPVRPAWGRTLLGGEGMG